MLLLQLNLQAAAGAAPGGISVPFGSGGHSLAAWLTKKHKKQPSRRAMRKRKRRYEEDEDDLLMLMII